MRKSFHLTWIFFLFFLLQNSGASTKLIPRLIDSTGSSETGELIPAEWNVFDVAQFLRVNDCAAYCDSFSKKVYFHFNTYLTLIF